MSIQLPDSNIIASIVVNTANCVLKQDNLNIYEKNFGNYVTDIDILMEKSLRAELSKLLPNSSFIGEELDNENSGSWCWIIDPIDGTTNFIYNFPFAISVALSYKNIIVSGVVYSPLDNTLYRADINKGAFKRIGDNEIPIKVDKNTATCPICLCGFPYDRNKIDKNYEIVKKLALLSADVKRMGPASLDICRVAEGQVAAYVELDLKIWDIAAAGLILQESGYIKKQIDDVFIFSCEELMKSITRAVISVNNK